MRSFSAAEALAVNRSGGSQIRSMWQSAEMTSYFIGMSSVRAWHQHDSCGGDARLKFPVEREGEKPMEQARTNRPLSDVTVIFALGSLVGREPDSNHRFRRLPSNRNTARTPSRLAPVERGTVTPGRG